MERKLVTPKTMRSGVWEHFGFEGNDSGEIMNRKCVWCRHCQSRLAYSGNTTNMSVHLAKCRQFTSSTGVKPATIALTSKRKVTPPIENVSNITSALVKFIIANMEHINLVENKEFQGLMTTACKDYEMPSSKTISNLVNIMTSDIGNIVFEELKSVQHACLTAEIWTSITMENYLGITCHFIDANWELQTSVLMPESLPTSYTCENIANLFAAIEKKWCLTGKVMAYVTDDVPHIVNAIEILMESERLYCLAHALQCSVNASLRKVLELIDIIEKCRKIEENFSHSVEAMTELNESQLKHGLPLKTLVKDIESRWMSTYDMLYNISGQQKEINAVLKENDETKHLMLKNNDAQKLEAILNVLEPLVEATTYLGGEKYACASIVLPIYYNLRKALVVKAEDPCYIKEFKEALGVELNEKQKHLSPLLVMATALDPRFKSLKFLTEEERQDVWNTLENELNEYISLTTTAAANLTEHFNHSTKWAHSTSPAKKKLKLMDDSDEGEDEDVIRSEDIAAKEIQTYRAQKKVDCEPTVWWKINAATHPNLAHMAKKYLGLVATSVPSDHFFSTAGHLLAKKRESLSGIGVKELVFLHSNHRKKSPLEQKQLISMEVTFNQM